MTTNEDNADKIQDFTTKVKCIYRFMRENKVLKQCVNIHYKALKRDVTHIMYDALGMKDMLKIYNYACNIEKEHACSVEKLFLTYVFYYSYNPYPNKYRTLARRLIKYYGKYYKQMALEEY